MWTQIASSLELLQILSLFINYLNVFHSSWILGQYERSIVLTYILRASSLSSHAKIILFRILRFFGVEESIWSGITNPFSDFPKETHPQLWRDFRGSWYYFKALKKGILNFGKRSSTFPKIFTSKFEHVLAWFYRSNFGCCICSV